MHGDGVGTGITVQKSAGNGEQNKMVGWRGDGDRTFGDGRGLGQH